MKAKLVVFGRVVFGVLTSPDSRRYEIALAILLWEALRKAFGTP